MADVARRSLRPASLPLIALLALAMLAAALSTAVTSFVAPAEVLGATTAAKTTAISGVNIRTTPSTAAPIKTTLGSGVTVAVPMTVVGSTWTVSCAGTTITGRSWTCITSIGGKTVKSLYGWDHLYAASGLFERRRRSSRRTASATSTKLTVWRPARAWALGEGDPQGRHEGHGHHDPARFVVDRGLRRHPSGNSWYRISAIDGKSVPSLYGVA